MPSLSVRVAAATAAARADHVDRCAFCQATDTPLEHWREDGHPRRLVCVAVIACHARFLALNDLDTAETLRDTLDAPTRASGGLPARCEGCGAHCKRGELCAGCRDDLKREGT